MLQLKIWVRNGTITVAESFKNLVFMLSYSVALEVLSFSTKLIVTYGIQNFETLTNFDEIDCCSTCNSVFLVVL